MTRRLAVLHTELELVRHMFESDPGADVVTTVCFACGHRENVPAALARSRCPECGEDDVDLAQVWDLGPAAVRWQLELQKPGRYEELIDQVTKGRPLDVVIRGLVRAYFEWDAISIEYRTTAYELLTCTCASSCEEDELSACGEGMLAIATALDPAFGRIGDDTASLDPMKVLEHAVQLYGRAQDEAPGSEKARALGLGLLYFTAHLVGISLGRYAS